MKNTKCMQNPKHEKIYAQTANYIKGWNKFKYNNFQWKLKETKLSKRGKSETIKKWKIIKHRLFYSVKIHSKLTYRKGQNLRKSNEWSKRSK